jgi:hypothetical protein
MPKRIQMTRKRPWRADNPDAVKVDRSTKWGNPFRIGCSVCSGSGRDFESRKIETRQDAVNAFEDMLSFPDRKFPADSEILSELKGRDLACWCPLDAPCHADVLLRYANSEEKPGGQL